MVNSFKNQLTKLSNPQKALEKAKYFKSKEGQYGEGDQFIGLTNGQIHEISRKFRKELTLSDLDELIKDPIHEIRFAALSVLVLKYKKAKIENEKNEIVDLFLKNVAFINNWDLVDCSCYFILGPHLLTKIDKKILFDLANSGHLWSERIAIVSTLHFIRNNHFQTTFEISNLLLSNKNDLIHKAIGWMLREIWKKGGNDLVEQYLKKNITTLARTTLRYAIEKMPEVKRKEFLEL
jgi:3-methyladenine DNA glycosylase AlkD